MKIYLCGPMTGRKQFNIPAFDAMAADLRDRGYEVVSPAELDDPRFRELCLLCPHGTIDELNLRCFDERVPTSSWGDLLARDVKLIADDGIEAIVAMQGWGLSRGACLETFVGRLSGLPILSYPSLKPIAQEVLGAVHGRACEVKPPVVIEGYDEAAKEGALREFPPLLVTPEVKARYSQMGGVLCEVAEPLDEKRRADEGLYAEEYRNRISDKATEEYFERGRQMEAETRVVDEATGGEKGAKEAVLGDLCPKALMQVATVAGFGRKKYARLNYLKGYDWSLSYDALQRHLHAFWAREDTDSESGLLHLAHASWHCLCLLAFYLRGLGKDDRP